MPEVPAVPVPEPPDVVREACSPGIVVLFDRRRILGDPRLSVTVRKPVRPEPNERPVGPPPPRVRGPKGPGAPGPGVRIESAARASTSGQSRRFPRRVEREAVSCGFGRILRTRDESCARREALVEKGSPRVRDPVEPPSPTIGPVVEPFRPRVSIPDRSRGPRMHRHRGAAEEGSFFLPFRVDEGKRLVPTTGKRVALRRTAAGRWFLAKKPRKNEFSRGPWPEEECRTPRRGKTCRPSRADLESPGRTSRGPATFRPECPSG